MNESLKAAFAYWRAVRVTKTGLPGFTAVEAIKLARADVDMGKERHASSSAGYGPAFEMRGAKAMRWIEKPSTCGLRFVGYAHDLATLKHTGWFVDNDQNETVKGVVFQLPSRNGKAIFVSGYEDWNNGSADSNGPVCLDFDDIEESDEPAGGNYSDDVQNYEAARDAARYADQLAEWIAENEREYQAAWHAGSRFADLGHQIANERKEALELLAERRAARDDGKAFPAICATIRQRVAKLLDDIAGARKQRSKLMQGDYVSDWLPGWNSHDKRLVDAFNESTGL